MQTIVIAVLIVIAGLIGALLVCATNLLNRARAANTTLRRIEETLLAMNRVRAIDSAIKSAEPAKQSQPTDAGNARFLTMRELKTMSGAGRQRTNAAAFSFGRKPPRTSAPNRTAGVEGEPSHESAPAEHAAEVTTQDTTGASLQFVDSAQPGATFAKRGPVFEVADVAPAQEMLAEPRNEDRLESSIEISWPGLDQQMANLELDKGVEVALVHENLSVASSVPQSALGSEVPQPVREDKIAPKSNDMDESRRKKKEQELMLIISSRRRRARAGR